MNSFGLEIHRRTSELNGSTSLTSRVTYVGESGTYGGFYFPWSEVNPEFVKDKNIPLYPDSATGQYYVTDCSIKPTIGGYEVSGAGSVLRRYSTEDLAKHVVPILDAFGSKLIPAEVGVSEDDVKEAARMRYPKRMKDHERLRQIFVESTLGVWRRFSFQ